MPSLDHDRLVFRFPSLEAEAKFSVTCQRTLRIPDSDQTYNLPPGFGPFPLRHAEDFRATLPRKCIERGGVILPIWQAEAMWLEFRGFTPSAGLDFPVAIKVAAGKVNAVTGNPWCPGLQQSPQNYVVSPAQPWLDGFAIKPGIIRQFVAMPLGDGYSAEEQLTGNADWGGLQIAVTPLKQKILMQLRQLHDSKQPATSRLQASSDNYCAASMGQESDCLGLAPGGRMRQPIYPDGFGVDAWDVDKTDRVFIHLIHAKNWKSITGENAPNQPPTAQEYARAGLPWYDYYGSDKEALPGSRQLAGLSSVSATFKKSTGADMPHSNDVVPGKLVSIKLAERHLPRLVRTGTWET